MKSDFATQVVEKSGRSPEEIIKNPVKVLGDYWYNNVNIDFLPDAVAVNSLYFSLYDPCVEENSDLEIAAELRKGLTALQLEAAVIDKACSSAPRPELLGHRDVFAWGLVFVDSRLPVSLC